MAQIGKALRFEILARDGFRCRYCGASSERISLHVDHILPRALGGRDDAANLVTACSDCNLGKSDRKILALPTGFALTEDMRPSRLRRARKVWDDVGKCHLYPSILDVGDRADGQTLALLHCSTHNRDEWHWVEDQAVSGLY